MASVGEFLLGKPGLCMSKHGSDRGQVDCLVSSFVPVYCSTMRIPKTVFSLCGPRLGSTETFLLEQHSAERNRRALFPSLSLRFANIPDTRVGRSSDLLSCARENSDLLSRAHNTENSVQSSVFHASTRHSSCTPVRLRSPP
jgi:hypothetical protein